MEQAEWAEDLRDAGSLGPRAKISEMDVRRGQRLRGEQEQGDCQRYAAGATERTAV